MEFYLIKNIRDAWKAGHLCGAGQEGHGPGCAVLAFSMVQKSFWAIMCFEQVNSAVEAVLVDPGY